MPDSEYERKNEQVFFKGFFSRESSCLIRCSEKIILLNVYIDAIHPTTTKTSIEDCGLISESQNHIRSTFHEL